MIMAPSDTTTNPRKRKQPPFNPPRPTTNGTGVSKPKVVRKTNVGSIFSDSAKKSKSKPRPKPKVSRQRPGVRAQEPEDDEDDDDASESLLLDEAAEEDDSEEAEDGEQDGASDADMMLAEVTRDRPEDENAEPAIPIPLLHRLMHHSLKNPEDTKLSTDARACVGKYIEVFIREAIARCAFEVNEKVPEGASDGALGHDDGWLEVEDLERVGGQLVLDF